MKSPKVQLTVIRHDVAMHNMLSKQLYRDKLYQEFCVIYDKNPDSEQTKKIAQKIFKTNILNIEDHKIPLILDTSYRAVKVGSNLKDLIELPDLILISPYLRVKQTLDRLSEGWIDLKNLPMIEDFRLQEQNVGLSFPYNDWRLYYAINPHERQKKEKVGLSEYRYPEGENVPDVKRRIKEWVDEIKEKYSDKNILVITHHRTLLAIRAVLENLTQAQIEDIDLTDRPINLGVTTYTISKDAQPVFSLQGYNKRLY